MATAAGRVEPLADSKDIGAVIRLGVQRAGRLLVVYARHRRDEHPTRIAMIASRKVGGAVARNRARRLLREATRGLSWRQGVDVVLVARAACPGSTFHDVQTELEMLAGQLGLRDSS